MLVLLWMKVYAALMWYKMFKCEAELRRSHYLIICFKYKESYFSSPGLANPTDAFKIYYGERVSKCKYNNIIIIIVIIYLGS